MSNENSILNDEFKVKRTAYRALLDIVYRAAVGGAPTPTQTELESAKWLLQHINPDMVED